MNHPVLPDKSAISIAQSIHRVTVTVLLLMMAVELVLVLLDDHRKQSGDVSFTIRIAYDAFSVVEMNYPMRVNHIGKIRGIR
jgi:hypothetical protein